MADEVGLASNLLCLRILIVLTWGPIFHAGFLRFPKARPESENKILSAGTSILANSVFHFGRNRKGDILRRAFQNAAVRSDPPCEVVLIRSGGLSGDNLKPGVDGLRLSWSLGGRQQHLDRLFANQKPV